MIRIFPDFLNENKDNNLTCEYLIPDVVTKLFKEKKSSLRLLTTDSVWHGVTYREDKDNVVSSLKNQFISDILSPTLSLYHSNLPL